MGLGQVVVTCWVDYSKPWQVFSPEWEMHLIGIITRSADIHFGSLESGPMWEGRKVSKLSLGEKEGN